MAELKTKRTDESVEVFLNTIPDAQRRADCFAVSAIMQEITGAAPKMWGPAIVGFGEYQYKYTSGRGGDWFLTGFSPRKQNLTLYIMAGFDIYPDLMAQLGKYKTGKSCLYINRLADIDVEVLKKMIVRSLEWLAQWRHNQNKI